jgi:hypothetical protein
MENLNQDLASELLKMSEVDQEMRNHAQLTDEWDASIDERNTTRLKEIVAESGWPTITTVGKEAARAAWLLVQHADHDPDFQTTCLEIMKNLPTDEISPTDLAYLEDRVRINTGRPQLYGTQFYGEGDTFGPRLIEDEADLDKRRSEVGLKPFAEYNAAIKEINKQHQETVASKNK